MSVPATQLNVKPTAPPAETSVAVVAPSLPPAPQTGVAPPPTKKPLPKLPRNSMVRKKAFAIIALRAQGMSTEQIAAELDIKPASIYQYLWRASKAGLLPKTEGGTFLDPRDQVEVDLTQRVTRNMREFLDSDDESIRKEVTLELAKGALFKKFDPEKGSVANPQMNVLSIRIEMPEGPPPVIRAGTVGGTPSYVEGEIVGEDD